MKESYDSIWNYCNEYKVVTTNGIVKSDGSLVMGDGVAKQAVDIYGDKISFTLGEYVKKYGNRPFILKEEKIITWPTKENFKDKSKIDFVTSNGKKVLEIVNKYKIEKIYSPLPGCGLGGLKWELVKEQLKYLLDDRFIFCLY